MPTIPIGPAPYDSGNYTVEELTKQEATQRQESARKLKELLPPEAVFEPEYVVAADFVPEGILDLAAKRKAGLIVMGATRTRSARAAAHMPWTVIHHVISEAECPVLTAMA